MGLWETGPIGGRGWRGRQVGRVEGNSVDRWVKIGKGMKEGDRRKRPKAKKGKRKSSYHYLYESGGQNGTGLS